LNWWHDDDVLALVGLGSFRHSLLGPSFSGGFRGHCSKILSMYCPFWREDKGTV
jgi:hypothetical protein